MSVKRSSKSVAKTLGLGAKAKRLHSISTRQSKAEQLPVSGLKEDRSRIRMSREGNDLRTFTPAGDAKRQQEARRAAAQLKAKGA
jgi:hypothetical protein